MTATLEPKTDIRKQLDRPNLSNWPRWTLLRHLIWAVIGLVVLLVASNYFSTFDQTVIATICYTAIAAAGLTVLTGLSGQVSLGQGAFMAVGAYTGALLTNDLQWDLGAVLVASTLAAALVGLLVGIAGARLRGPYLAGVTLALALGLPTVANYHGFQNLLQGENGITVNSQPVPAALGENFQPTEWQAWVSGLCLVLTLFFLANLVSSRFGRDMRLIREDESAAALAGVRVARTQVLAFIVAAACGGLGGGVLAWVNTLAAPGAFQLTLSLSLLTAAVVGGLGSLAGAVYGSVIVTLLPLLANDLAQNGHLPSTVYANIPLVVYGVVLILVVVLFPGGIQAGLIRLWRALHITIR